MLTIQNKMDLCIIFHLYRDYRCVSKFILPVFTQTCTLRNRPQRVSMEGVRLLIVTKVCLFIVNIYLSVLTDWGQLDVLNLKKVQKLKRLQFFKHFIENI